MENIRWSVFNQKGGVGKTTITCNLAAAFAQLGRKVLVVDLDVQANATQYLLSNRSESLSKTIADFFNSTLTIKLFKESLHQSVYATQYDNLWIIPACPTLGELQPKLEQRYKIFKLAHAVEELAQKMGFDDVIFDTPPALNFYSMSALLASQRVLIPFDCDAFSNRALLQVLDTIEEIKEDHRPDLKVAGIIINQFQKSARLPKDAVDALLSESLPVLRPFLSSSIAIKESHAASEPLVALYPRHKTSLEYKELAENLLTRKGRQRKEARSKARSDSVQIDKGLS